MNTGTEKKQSKYKKKRITFLITEFTLAIVGPFDNIELSSHNERIHYTKSEKNRILLIFRQWINANGIIEQQHYNRIHYQPDNNYFARKKKRRKNTATIYSRRFDLRADNESVNKPCSSRTPLRWLFTRNLNKKNTKDNITQSVCNLSVVLRCQSTNSGT